MDKTTALVAGAGAIGLVGAAFTAGYLIGDFVSYGPVRDWYTDLEWSIRRRFFHRDESVVPEPDSPPLETENTSPTIDKKERNVLILCHGETMPRLTTLVDYETHRTYTVDMNQSLRPSFVSRIEEGKFWYRLESESFDVVICCFCHCHTYDLVSSRGDYVFRQIHRVLKPEGKVMCKDITRFRLDKGSLKAIYVEYKDVERHGFTFVNQTVEDFEGCKHGMKFDVFLKAPSAEVAPSALTALLGGID